MPHSSIKLCIACRHCRCHANRPPECEAFGIELVTGESRTALPWCSSERSSGGLCGISGYYFEPKKRHIDITSPFDEERKFLEVDA